MSDITSDYERIEKRTRIHGNIRNGVIYFFLCLWALIVLFPFYWEDTCGTLCFSLWSPLPLCWWSSLWRPSRLQG